MKTRLCGLLMCCLSMNNYANTCTESNAPEDVVQAQLEAYNAHDVEWFASCYDDDVKVYQLPNESPSLQGIEEFKKSYSFLKTVPDTYKAVIEKRLVNGPIVIDHERVTGLGKGRDDILVFAIYEVREGKIKHVWFPPVE